MPVRKKRVADIVEEELDEPERKKRDTEAREQRQKNLSQVVATLARREALRENRPRMPGCSPCQKAGVVCWVSKKHENCARCIELNTTSCDATLKPDRVIELLEDIDVRRARQAELVRQMAQLGKELASLNSSIDRDEAKVKNAVEREIRILNTWDASDFNPSSVTVPVDETMFLDVGVDDDLAWLNRYTNSEPVDDSFLEHSNL